MSLAGKNVSQKIKTNLEHFEQKKKKIRAKLYYFYIRRNCNMDKLQYLKDIINDLKESDTWKIQLTITINTMSSKDMMKSV